MDESNGHDIGPGEERHFVSVLRGFSTEADSVYEEQYPIHRHTRNGRFYEPTDLTDEDEGSCVDPVRNRRSEHQKFHGERERLKTFEGHWKPEYNVTAEDLAREGFIYKGPGDMVICVFCLKTIRKWDDGDLVSEEHKRLYPNCPWVKGKVTYNIPISKKDDMKRNMRIVSKGQPQISDMQTPDARQNSFKSCTKSNNVEGLVNAGFFYDSNNDVLRCFYCGIKISSWDVDTVERHHRETYPDCPMSVQTEEAEPVKDLPKHLTDTEMNSPAVQAIRDIYGDDFSMEDIKKAIQTLRISKGESHVIKSEDILGVLEQDLDS